MKAIKNLLILTLLSAPVVSFAQQQDTVYYKKKVKRTTTTTNPADIVKDTLNKDTGPILNDNGSISTTGTIRTQQYRPEGFRYFDQLFSKKEQKGIQER